MGVILLKGQEKEFSPKLEIAKAKILFNSEDEEEKNRAIEIFTNVFENSSVDLKYRLEAFGYLLNTQFDNDQAYNKLVNILMNEELDELKVLIVIRKIKEIKKENDFKEWVFNEVVNNSSIKSNKRYMLIKGLIESFPGLESQILDLITKNNTDFFNFVLILKNNPDYTEKFFKIILDKFAISNYLEKLIYLNLLYALGYKIEEFLNQMSNFDYYFLFILFSMYFKDIKLLDKIFDKINDKEADLKSLFLHHFLFSLKNNTPTLIFTPEIESSLLQNIFYKLVYYVLTKNDGLKEQLKNYVKENYGGIYLAIIQRYLEICNIENLNVEIDLSDVESEYLFFEDALIEINSSKFVKEEKVVEYQKETKINEEYIENVKEFEERTLEEENEQVKEEKKEAKEEIEQVFEEISQDIDELLTKHDEKKEKDELMIVLKKFFDDEIDLNNEEFRKLIEEGKENSWETLETFIFDEKYLEEKFEKVKKIIELSQKFDQNKADIFIKNIVYVLLSNENFNSLAEMVDSFKFYNKVNFHNYIANNEFIEWSEREEKLLSQFLDYLRNNQIISLDNLGKFCMMVMDSNVFSRNLKKKAGEIIENLFT